MVGFSEDLKNGAAIAKAVSGFGILVQWHESENLVRVVAKVYLNDDAKIPDSVKVNAGLPQKGRSWIVPCYVFKKQNVVELQDEKLLSMSALSTLSHLNLPLDGPCSPSSLRCHPAGSNNGSALHVDASGPHRWQAQVAPQDPVYQVQAQVEDQNANTERPT